MAEIRWFGHNCFRIKAKEATVLTDPVGKNTGYTLPKQTADIVTLSHDHPGHNNLAAVKPDYQLINGPGEYEVHAVFLTGFRTYHDQEKGAEHGYNTIYLIEMSGLRLAHLGDLGHTLNDDQVETLGTIDVLFAPAGGGPLLSTSDMAEVIGRISPRMLIPMQYKAGKGDKKREEIDGFVRHLGVEMPTPVDKINVRQSDLTDQMQLVLLKPEG